VSGCCDGCGLDVLRQQQKRTLISVLIINATMFVIMVAAAFHAGSSALLSDSLDNFGDAFTYAVSLYAIGLGARAKAQVALLKGGLIMLGALLVAGQIVYRLFHPAVPIFETMGAFSLLAVSMNSVCLYLLWRHRQDDINMSSVWECSRNDIVANLAVFIAAIAVWLTASGWPDLLIAAALAVFLTRSAFHVIIAARQQLMSSTS
jgi:Co/Zn/Cd efflux system component